jgi:hypothetical protein
MIKKACTSLVAMAMQIFASLAGFLAIGLLSKCEFFFFGGHGVEVLI